MPQEPRSLEPLVGNIFIPQWALRPGSYAALRGLTAEMPLWLLILSRDSDWRLPCYATLEQLGATLGCGRKRVSRHLDALQKAHLLFVVDRGHDPKTQRRRALARWALDPFADDVWRPVVEEALPRIAEEDGQDGRWVHRAVTSLDAFHRRNRGLRNRIGQDMAIPPDQQRKRRRKGRKQSRGPKKDPGPKKGPEGRYLPGGGSGAPSTNGGRPETGASAREPKREKKPAAAQTDEPTR